MEETKMNKQELIKKYEEYENGLFDIGARAACQLFLKDLEQLDEPEKVKVPQFVADFIAEQKKLDHTLSYSIDASMSDIVAEWYWNNSELFAQAWIFGYEVEKEKRYLVILKNRQPLVKSQSGSTLYFSQDITARNYKGTQKELEEAGFGWVFDCEGVEVEEVD